MKKHSVYAASFLLILAGCNTQTNSWRDYNSKKSNFVQAADIKAGEKLKKEHPDEDFVYNNYIMDISFSKNPDYEEWVKKSKEKKRKYVKLKWVKNNKNLSVELNDEFTESEITIFKEWYETQYFNYYSYGNVNEDDVAEKVQEIKRDRNNKPPGEYLSNVKHSFEITSLHDFNQYDIYIPVSNGEFVKNVEVDYGRGTFEPDHMITPYESNGIFYQNLNIYNADVYFPTVGSRAYVDYTDEFSDLKYNTTIYIPEVYFQEKKVVSFAIPSWLDITIVEKNFEGITFTKTSSAAKPIKKKIVKTLNENGTLTTPTDSENDSEPASTKPGAKTKPKDKKAKPSSGLKYITYEFTDVKPRDYKNSKGSRGQSYNYPHFLIQYNSATEGMDKKPLTGTTTGLYKWYNELIKGLKNDTVALAKFTHKLIDDKPTMDEKVKAIYYWVQDNVRYIAFEDGIAGFKPEECDEVYNNRYGDCKGMANLLVNMLHVAGYDARRVWIGTRHLNYDYSTPSIAVNNHMIAALKLDTGFIYLDGTESFCPLKQYAHRIQGRQVMIEEGDSFQLRKIPEYGPEFNLQQVSVSGRIDGKKLIAKTDKTYFGESRLDFIRSLNSLELQDREKALYNYVSEHDISLKPSNIVTSDITNREGKATIAYDLEIENHVIESNGRKYLNIDWERSMENLDFDTARRSDFDFGQKICEKYEMKLDVGSMKAEFIPPPVQVDNDYYRISLGITQQGNQLVYKKEFIVKQGFLPLSELKNWNELHKKLNLFYNDYVILK